ncbi:response regulator transcription factor [Nocardioides marinus]|uniref:DNA-binding response OmpR family regulator n=1 Tax=Nocardioides marinus TaxID=374514 RepID=A0A7Y9YDE7_9ACTN|nr:response regulator transcription factor [Nocardioides marinus]NYI10108.1 DNA-binding response OmpR family regulator [Nocardioides marinus]
MTESRHRALVVDDDPDIADLVVMVLEGLDMDVSVAGTGEEALALARERQPDLVTLDLTLPDADGTEICERLRRFTDAYIIMITGRDAETDRLIGLEVGADEYLAKPFSPRELRARATALLRRPRSGLRAGDGGEEAAVVVRSADVELTDLGGGLLVDPLTGATRHRDENVPLTPTEAKLLVTLTRQAGEPMERADLATEVRGGDFIASDFLIDVQVAGLRRKLRAATGRDRLTVVRGTAYQLTVVD